VLPNEVALLVAGAGLEGLVRRIVLVYRLAALRSSMVLDCLCMMIVQHVNAPRCHLVPTKNTRADCHGNPCLSWL
jgi:hypothetical protein